MSNVRFIQADVRHLTFQPRSVDHVITDPPFSRYVQDRLLQGNRNLKLVKEVSADFVAIDDTSSGLELTELVKFVQVAKRWALFCCDIESLGDYKRADVGNWRRSCIYTKARAMPQLTGDRPGNRCEGIATFHNGKQNMRWNGKGTAGYWRAPSDEFDEVETPEFFCSPENRSTTLHPTAKPLLLALALVHFFTDVNEVVLDPFCGTGAFGIACALLERNYIGCDLSGEHVANASKRMALALASKDKHLARFEEWKKTKGVSLAA